MRVIRKRPGEPAEEIEIGNTLKALQNEVGGHIETVPFVSDTCVIRNDEGRLNGEPYNCELLGVDFVGTILVVGVDGDEFCDVPAGAWMLFNSEGRMTVRPKCGNEQLDWDYRFCPICGNPIKEKAPAEVELRQDADQNDQLQDTAKQGGCQDGRKNNDRSGD